MTVPEADKINELYKQLDVLTGENAALKSAASTHDHSDLVDSLKSIEAKLDNLLDRGKTK